MVGIAFFSPRVSLGPGTRAGQPRIDPTGPAGIPKLVALALLHRKALQRFIPTASAVNMIVVAL